ncbi:MULTISPECIES: sialate O-acetylesterase [unclassified Pseudoalteromonas]|uniref:sialate O-acetylesterase n=1 Tax=unclassified Pseudoalteromonas TaxID=194690 RepID=UPI00110C13ED|nr:MULTISPECIES: sialate O-acetylesterase [unclassified Pseudoalteromonas]TMP48127.1 hypothetical protein CWB80_04830 [Pseudoalteromonas sp. S1650]TMP66339.1 hypothetical protein CWB79_12565 [Pseudoalteromonas sp. S1649]
MAFGKRKNNVKKLALCGLLAISTQSKADDYLLYFMGGQSNMEGFGFNKDLPAQYEKPVVNTLFFFGNPVADDALNGGKGVWTNLMPGFGTGARSTEHSIILSDRFGPELSFGKRLSELTGKKIAIIKYARGGSSIALGASGFGTWGQNYADNTKINQWDNFQTTVRAALANNDIDGDGVADTLVPAGIIWMQGEADAYHEQASKVYLANLTSLMNDMKMTFGNKELPIILGRIEDSGKTPETRMMPHIESVWNAQKKYVKSNANAHLVAFDEPVEFIEDKWHYKSNYYIKLGNLFAEKAAETLAK